MTTLAIEQPRFPELAPRIHGPAHDSVWAVRLRDGDDEVSSLEIFDRTGAPALLVFGVPHRWGTETLAWRAFIGQLTQRTSSCT